jgi:hypothetical protein
MHIDVMQPQEIETQNHLHIKSQKFQTAENITHLPTSKSSNPLPFETFLDPPIPLTYLHLPKKSYSGN